MPGNILNADTGFPQFSEGESSDQKLDKVMNYLYMLLEQLRYSLNNLDADNFNDTGLQEIADGIARPLQTSFENELVKTNALIEGWSDEYGSQIELLTEWQKGANQSISSLETTASDQGAAITLLNQWVGVDENSGLRKSVAALETIADTQGATISSLVSWQEGTGEDLVESVGVIEAQANDNSADISLIASFSGSGTKRTATITAAAASTSFIEMVADNIDLSGFVTFNSLEEDGQATVNGNNVSLILDASTDNGYRDLESESRLNFIYRRNTANSTQNLTFGEIFTSVDGDTTSLTSRYALNIRATSFYNNYDVEALPSLKLYADGRISLESRYGVYVGATEAGYISLDAEDNTRIFANKQYSELSAIPSGYSFNKDGIYYGSKKILGSDGSGSGGGTVVAVFG